MQEKNKALKMEVIDHHFLASLGFVGYFSPFVLLFDYYLFHIICIWLVDLFNRFFRLVDLQLY